MARQIQLKGEYRHDEADASGTISPGSLIELTSSSDVQVHASEGGYAERMFAVEDALQGDTVDDDYSNGDKVMFHHLEPGAEVYALITAGEDIAVADKLVSAGDGSLEEETTPGGTVYQIVAVALEACDLTASGAVATLAKVRIL